RFGPTPPLQPSTLIGMVLSRCRSDASTRIRGLPGQTASPRGGPPRLAEDPGEPGGILRRIHDRPEPVCPEPCRLPGRSHRPVAPERPVRLAGAAGHRPALRGAGPEP